MVRIQETGFKATRRGATPVLAPTLHEADADLDRLLGNKLLFDLRTPQIYGGPSPPTLYRARRAGLLEFVKSGNRSMLSRATMKKILREGLGPIAEQRSPERPPTPDAPTEARNRTPQS